MLPFQILHAHLTSHREFGHPCGITVERANVHVIVEDRGNWFTVNRKVIEFILQITLFVQITSVQVQRASLMLKKGKHS